MRIALLGNTQAQAARLAALLPFAHELLAVPDAGPAAPLTVDAVVTMRFAAPDAARINCRLLQVSGAGLDAIALDAVPPTTWVCNVYEHEGPIAEFVMLAVLRHRLGPDDLAREFRYETWGEAFRTRSTHAEVAGLTLGLLGFGHIGKAVAARARAFGMRVMAISASGRASPEANWAGGADRLDEMLAAADVLVIACPLTAATRGMIGADQIARLKPSALLINVARGDIVAEEPLYEALAERRIAGAVLDTWYAYPSPDHPAVPPSRLRFDRLANVVCTPHIAGWTEKLMERRYRFIAGNLARLRAGEELRNVVRPTCGPGRTTSAEAGAQPDAGQIYTAPSSATAPPECRGHVLISGSYGGDYNAWHAARHGVRAVILNDAGIGKDQAGIHGLIYLDAIGVAAATADARTCHIGDGEHMLAQGRVSHVNRAAAALGCAAGMSVADCAERMRHAAIPDYGALAPIEGGRRYLVSDFPGERRVICLDAAPLLQPEDAGAIAVTGSHAALFRGQPDDVIKPQVFAAFFSDAGVGLDGAGIARLAELERRGIIAGTVSAETARIGDSRSILQTGVLSFVNASAERLGGRPGQALRDFVASLRVP